MKDQKPNPAALRDILEAVGRARSIQRMVVHHGLRSKQNELLRRSALQGLQDREGRAEYLDIRFGSLREEHSTTVDSVWVRRGPILAIDRARNDTNGRYKLFVVSPTADIRFYGCDTPSTDAIDVTNEPGPWWPALLQEIPKIQRGLAEFQRVTDEVVREHEGATRRRYAEKQQQQLAAARALFAKPGEKTTGCTVILVLVLAAFASATLPLLW